MNVEYTCHFCQKKLTVKNGKLGTSVKCPKCKSVVLATEVPDLDEEIEKAEAALKEMKPPARDRSVTRKEHNSMPGLKLAVMAFKVLVIGLLTWFIIWMTLSDKDGGSVLFQILFFVFVFVVPVVVGKNVGAGRNAGPVVGALLGLFLSWLGVVIVSMSEKRVPSKKCPFCAERIKTEAVVCRYCGRDLPEAKAS